MKPVGMKSVKAHCGYGHSFPAIFRLIGIPFDCRCHPFRINDILLFCLFLLLYCARLRSRSMEIYHMFLPH